MSALRTLSGTKRTDDFECPAQLMLVAPLRLLAFLLGQRIRLCDAGLRHAADEERRIAGREGILERFINETVGDRLISSALRFAVRSFGRHRTAPRPGSTSPSSRRCR